MTTINSRFKSFVLKILLGILTGVWSNSKTLFCLNKSKHNASIPYDLCCRNTSRLVLEDKSLYVTGLRTEVPRFQSVLDFYCHFESWLSFISQYSRHVRQITPTSYFSRSWEKGHVKAANYAAFCRFWRASTQFSFFFQLVRRTSVTNVW